MEIPLSIMEAEAPRISININLGINTITNFIQEGPETRDTLKAKMDLTCMMTLLIILMGEVVAEEEQIMLIIIKRMTKTCNI
jgi:hypothetical protein